MDVSMGKVVLRIAPIENVTRPLGEFLRDGRLVKKGVLKHSITNCFFNTNFIHCLPILNRNRIAFYLIHY
jgi:hypothetical protein